MSLFTKQPDLSLKEVKDPLKRVVMVFLSRHNTPGYYISESHRSGYYVAIAIDREGVVISDKH